METLSTFPGICEGPMDSPHKFAVMWKLDIGFVASLSKPLNKHLTFHYLRRHGSHVISLWWKHTLQWHQNGRDGVWNHQPRHCLLNRLFRQRSKKTSKLRVTGLCSGNSSVTGEFPAQRTSNAENVSIWWRHHDTQSLQVLVPELYRKPNCVVADMYKNIMELCHQQVVTTKNFLHSPLHSFSCH